MRESVQWHENRAYPIMKLQGILLSSFMTAFVAYLLYRSSTPAAIFLFSILGSAVIVAAVVGSIRELLTVPVRVGSNQKEIFVVYRKLALKKEFYTESFETDRVKEIEISKDNAPWKNVYVFLTHTDIKKRHRGEVKSKREGIERINLGLFDMETVQKIEKMLGRTSLGKNEISNAECRKRVLIVWYFLPGAISITLSTVIFISDALIGFVCFLVPMTVIPILGHKVNKLVPLGLQIEKDTVLINYIRKKKEVPFASIIKIRRLDNVLTKKDCTLNLETEKERVHLTVDCGIADELMKKYEEFKRSKVNG